MNWPTTKAAWVQNLSVALVGTLLFLSTAFVYSLLPHYFWTVYRGNVALPWMLENMLRTAPLDYMISWGALLFFWVLFRCLPNRGCGWFVVLMMVPVIFISVIMFSIAIVISLESIAMIPASPDAVRLGANVLLVVGLFAFAVWQEWKIRHGLKLEK